MQAHKIFCDDVITHVLEDFPTGLAPEQAYVRSGMYLGWIIDKHLYSGNFEEVASTEIFRFSRKEISCTILGLGWSNYFTSEHLNTRAYRFTVFYHSSGLYRQDFEETLKQDLPSTFHVQDTWQNYDLLKSRITMRYGEWNLLKSLLQNHQREQRS